MRTRNGNGFHSTKAQTKDLWQIRILSHFTNQFVSRQGNIGRVREGTMPCFLNGLLTVCSWAE